MINIPNLPMPGAEVSKGEGLRPFATGIAGSNAAGGMEVSPLWVLCFVR
jgi:hypothetical protein